MVWCISRCRIQPFIQYQLKKRSDLLHGFFHCFKTITVNNNNNKEPQTKLENQNIDFFIWICCFFPNFHLVNRSRLFYYVFNFAAFPIFGNQIGVSEHIRQIQCDFWNITLMLLQPCWLIIFLKKVYLQSDCSSTLLLLRKSMFLNRQSAISSFSSRLLSFTQLRNFKTT